MKKSLILILTIAVALASCKKYEVQYGTETAATNKLLDEVYEIAYSTDKGVFLVNAAMTRSKMLVSFANKPSPEAGRVALSANRDKVAYVDPDNGVPVIVDTSGNVLVELTQYPNTKDLGWYNGDETLYLLANNQIHFYGRTLDLPSPLFVAPPYSFDYEVTTVDISKDLDVVYGAVYYKRSSGGGLYRDWYDSYHLNYKEPSLVDESSNTLNTSHYYTQNITVDSRSYYHTIRFLKLQYPSAPWGTRTKTRIIAKAYAEKTVSNIEFKDFYGLGGRGGSSTDSEFNVRVNPDGTLFKSIYLATEISYIETNLFWEVDMPSNAPLYVDWPPYF